MQEIIHGDSLEVMSLFLPDNSVDSIVCDPPYGLSEHKPQEVMDCLAAWLRGEEFKPNKRGFMGKTWDSWVPGPELWKECFRVLKPGGHILAFAGSRTHDLMSIALRLAGFECRDTVMWVYGSGFPKSMDIGKSLDKAAGAEREVIGLKVSNRPNSVGFAPGGSMGGGAYTERTETAPATDAAKQWDGWGTCLKPAFEPVLMFRKPLIGTVAENVLAFGTGGLNIDGCRVGSESTLRVSNAGTNGEGWGMGKRSHVNGSDSGRFPANLCHDGSPEVVALFPDSNGSGGSVPNVKITGYGDGVVGEGKSEYIGGERTKVNSGSGSAARFFYSAKCSKKDRDGSTHPTMKPTSLMAYLCRLVTPPGGVVLDPFMGSGSTGKAAVREGFDFIGIEREAEYVEIAKSRIFA